MQAQKGIRTTEPDGPSYQSTVKQAFCCAIAQCLRFCNVITTRNNSSGYKQLILRVNRIATSQILSSPSYRPIIIGTDPEPRVVDVGDQLKPQIMHRERGDCGPYAGVL